VIALREVIFSFGVDMATITMIPYTDQQSKKFYRDYYVQRGSGLDVYEGYTTMPQIGQGFGKTTSGLFNKAVPILTSVAKKVGKSALRTGLQLAEEALNGSEEKDRDTSVKTRVQKRFASEGINLLKEMTAPKKKRRRAIKGTPQRRRMVI
jgi:hypothetical protein